ncbi:dihydropteroate synthase [Paenarthrobacter sp. Z7-10]|uniref:dihydropteroate synthase n=1 Tax=Paenarthrobacter sp. Z7-10 TaxID=2787635 RepID=UPI0022A94133|nr:dihydropteroate synthase [Paenarthrobacter sp. Z7-10]MCZ2402752.1 dihydropteroate synthase [Paenarthrobacter sp. Z7-10]
MPEPAGVSPFFQPPLLNPIHEFGGRTLDFSRKVALMAIINRTPDSFYDGGRTFSLDAAVAASLQAVDDGADWVDIGGVPFSPGPALSPWEEAERVVPVIEAVAARSNVIISVDTFTPKVAELSIAAGAHVINDTTGLQDPDLAAVVAASDAHLVITHSLASPRTVFPRPHYEDVVAEVVSFLRAKVDLALKLGIAENRIILDPGHDLNKNTLHSLELTHRFRDIAALGFPSLAAVSNKDFIGETLGQEKQQRMAGSLAAAVMCVLGGARIVRMHNVSAAHSAVRLTEAALGWREPEYLLHNMGDVNAPVHR